MWWNEFGSKFENLGTCNKWTSAPAGCTVQYRWERIRETDTVECNKHWHSAYTDVYGNKYVKDSMKCKMRIKRLLYFELTGSWNTARRNIMNEQIHDTQNQHFNPLRTKRTRVIKGLSSYRAVNTLHFGYKNQSVNDV